mgnify:CR=1 FL=1
MSKNILAITGSYRKEGIIHQAVEIVVSALEQRMQTVEVLDLLDYHVEFCTNCRQCAQQPGDDPGKCQLADDMTLIIAKIEQADALLLAAPVNFGAITAIYKRFLERLICYAYWPYEKEYPTFRKKSHKNPAILITSSSGLASFGNRLSLSAITSLKGIVVNDPVSTSKH